MSQIWSNRWESHLVCYLGYRYLYAKLSFVQRKLMAVCVAIVGARKNTVENEWLHIFSPNLRLIARQTL